MHFQQKGLNEFIGEIEPGKKCIVTREDEVSYVKSHVVINGKEWRSIDEGLSKCSDKRIWGAEHGPLIFKKVEDMGKELNEEWLM